jgi:glutamate synthase (NADPH/NADH) small chain
MGRRVVVVGGGDTGADCISNAHREGAASVIQLDTYPPPAGSRPREIAGRPRQPKRMPSNYALDEGGERRSGVRVTALEGAAGRVARVHAIEVDAQRRRVPGTEFVLDADLVLIAVSFLHPAQQGLLRELGLEKDPRGNVLAPAHATSVEGVFATGDARVGQSLIVTAIAEGRRCAEAVHRWLVRA